MKSFIVLTGMLLIALMGKSGSSHRPPGPFTEEMKKNFNECREELGMTVEEVRELHRKHDFGNEKMRCMPACLMKKNGFLEEGKNLNIEKIVKAREERFGTDPVQAKEIIEECAEKAKEKEDECEFAQSFQRCTHTKMRHGHGSKESHKTDEE